MTCPISHTVNLGVFVAKTNLGPHVDVALESVWTLSLLKIHSNVWSHRQDRSSQKIKKNNPLHHPGGLSLISAYEWNQIFLPPVFVTFFSRDLFKFWRMVMKVLDHASLLISCGTFQTARNLNFFTGAFFSALIFEIFSRTDISLWRKECLFSGSRLFFFGARIRPKILFCQFVSCRKSHFLSPSLNEAVKMWRNHETILICFPSFILCDEEAS